MNIDLRTRAVSSASIVLAFAWGLANGNSWMPLIPLVSGFVFYFLGLIGVKSSVRNAAGYPKILLVTTAASSITTLSMLITRGFPLFDILGSFAFISLLAWFGKHTLVVIRSGKA